MARFTGVSQHAEYFKPKAIAYRWPNIGQEVTIQKADEIHKDHLGKTGIVIKNVGFGIFSVQLADGVIIKIRSMHLKWPR